MKIIHTSDVHIDSPLSSRLSLDKMNERRRELRLNWRRLISEAESCGARAVIIAGDLFDEGRISGRTAAYALDTVRNAKSITFLYLEGNHEGAALREVGLEIPENLIFFGEDWTYFEADGVTFAGRSEVTGGMFDTLTLPKNKKNILVLHGELRDSRCGDGIVGLRDLADKGVDYVALGHYHSYSEARFANGVAVYSGTPEGRGFDETGDKGYVILDTDGNGISHEFVPFAKRRLHIAELDVTGISRTAEIEERAKSVLAEIPRNDLVRLELVGGYSPELWKDTDIIKREFENSFYYFEIKDSSRPIINPDDYKYDKSLKGEFIRTVMADSELDEDTKAKIITCGINALMGEELF